MVDGRFFKKLLCLFIVLVISACTSSYYPTLPKKQLSSEEAHDILKRALLVSAQVESLKMLANTRLVMSDERYAFKYAIAANNENCLRVDILPQMGAYTLGVLIANKSGVSYIDAGNQEVYFSRDQKYLVNKALGLSLDASEVLAYFTARIPSFLLEKALREDSISVYLEDGGYYVLVWKDKQYYWKLDSESFLLEKVLIYDKFSRKLVLQFDYFFNNQEQKIQVLGGDLYASGSQGVVIPSRLELSLEKNDVKALMTLSGVRLNTVIPSDRFQFQVPAEYKFYEMGE